ncbi:carbohydrate porin, partial [Paraburkholderia sp. SIMBA_049]
MKNRFEAARTRRLDALTALFLSLAAAPAFAQSASPAAAEPTVGAGASDTAAAPTQAADVATPAPTGLWERSN